MTRPPSTHGRARRSRRQRPHCTRTNRAALAFEQLFGEVTIPPAVEREVISSRPPLPGWVRARNLLRALDSRVAQATLGDGETEAISLALEEMVEHVILDDLPWGQVYVIHFDPDAFAGARPAAPAAPPPRSARRPPAADRFRDLSARGQPVPRPLRRAPPFRCREGALPETPAPSAAPRQMGECASRRGAKCIT
jgi:hypothetical protein